MNRRNYLKTIAAAGAASALPARAAHEPIQLHVDLDVDPAQEKEMVSNYHKVFHPVITKQPGFVDVKLLKLRSAVAGQAPPNAAYRLLISFQSEEQRKTWVDTAAHKRVWPSIEKTLKGSKYGAVLYDVV